MFLPRFSLTIQNRKMAGDEESQSSLHCSHLNVAGACMHILFLAHFNFVLFTLSHMLALVLNHKTETVKQTSANKWSQKIPGSLTFNTKSQAQSLSFAFHLFYLLDNHACFEKVTPFKKATSFKTTTWNQSLLVFANSLNECSRLTYRHSLLHCCLHACRQKAN